MLVPMSVFPTLKSYKNSAVALVVVALHALVLWALQQGAFQSKKPDEIVIPISFKSIQAPKEASKIKETEVLPANLTPKPTAKQPPKVTPPQVPPKQADAVPAKPISDIQSTSASAAIASSVVASEKPSQPSAVLGTAAGNASGDAPGNAATVAAATKPNKTLPSAVAEDAYVPQKSYPRQSITMGEEGVVVVRVFIGADGLPKDADVQKSSGFERLDRAALVYVMQSRYKAGTFEGVPTEMWMGRTLFFKLRS
jgi:periplasmic protein TonB